MELIMRVILAIYASLMMLATWQASRMPSSKESELSWLNYLTDISAIVLLIATFLSRSTFVTLAILSLVAFQVLAILRGKLQGNFHWQHHVVRLVITVCLIGLLILV